MSWTVQKQKRPKGLYYQAVHGTGKERRIVTLGYLTEAEADVALVRLRAGGDNLAATEAPPLPGAVTVPKVVNAEGYVDVGLTEPTNATERGPVGPSYPDAAIKSFALGEGIDKTLKEITDAHVRALVASGEYGRLTLQEFVETVWAPVRQAENAPGVWDREKSIWKTIYKALGNIPLAKLDAIKWGAFLLAQEKWSGRYKLIAQNAYRVALKYAAETGAIREVHSFRKIAGSTKRTRSEPVPFSAEEMGKLLSHAPSTQHKAMWATGYATGLRPGELVKMEWQDIDFRKNNLKVRGTKTKLSDATIPLPPLARGVLLALHFERGEPTEGPLFLWKGARMKQIKGRGALASAVKAAGITDGRRVHANIFRHSFASACAWSGVPKVAARAMMRHSSTSEMLDRHYEHATDPQVRDAMTRFPVVAFQDLPPK